MYFILQTNVVFCTNFISLQTEKNVFTKNYNYK